MMKINRPLKIKDINKFRTDLAKLDFLQIDYSKNSENFTIKLSKKSFWDFIGGNFIADVRYIKKYDYFMLHDSQDRLFLVDRIKDSKQLKDFLTVIENNCTEEI